MSSWLASYVIWRRFAPRSLPPRRATWYLPRFTLAIARRRLNASSACSHRKNKTSPSGWSRPYFVRSLSNICCLANPNPILEEDAQVSTRVLASEVMHANAAVSNLIASGNLNQVATIIQTSGVDGMWTLDDSLAHLWRRRLISEKTAKSLARNPEILMQISRRTRA